MELNLELSPKYLEKIDRLARSHSMTRDDFLGLIANVLDQVGYCDEETIAEIRDSGIISTGDLDIEETADPAVYRAGFSVTFRLEEITREDCLNWDEYFQRLLSLKTGEE